MTARGDQIGLTTESESALAVKLFYAAWGLDLLSLSSIIFLSTKIHNHMQYTKIIAQVRSFERCRFLPRERSLQCQCVISCDLFGCLSTSSKDV